jgi:hypothetical protein
VKGFRASRRSPGARPIKGARGSTGHQARPPDAALGRASRGLIGPGSQARGSRSGPAALDRARGAGARGLGRTRGIVTPARAGGLLGMVTAGFLFTLVTGPTAFGLSRTEIPELTWTATEAVVEALAVPVGENVFQLDTAPLEAALEVLPGVAAAEVSVALPDAAVIVAIDERAAVLAWETGGRRYIADATGTIFATVDAAATLPPGVALVEDRRAASRGAYAIGGHIGPIDLDVATRLASLTPADVGSTAGGLRVVITDADGFVVEAARTWDAVFGFYSPATRPTDMIPGQVRLLRSLLLGREGEVRRVILASDSSGTYVPRETPR